MKRKFYALAKQFGLKIEKYQSFRSDMGCQVFDITAISPNGSMINFKDSYFIGENKGSIILDMFKNEAIDLIKTN